MVSVSLMLTLSVSESYIFSRLFLVTVTSAISFGSTVKSIVISTPAPALSISFLPISAIEAVSPEISAVILTEVLSPVKSTVIVSFLGGVTPPPECRLGTDSVFAVPHTSQVYVLIPSSVVVGGVVITPVHQIWAALSVSAMQAMH